MSVWTKDLNTAPKTKADGSPQQLLVRFPGNPDWECPVVIEWKLNTAEASGSTSDVEFWGFSDQLIEDAMGYLEEKFHREVEWMIIPD